MAAGHGEKLGRKREQAVAALLTEATVEAAAAKAGVSYAALKNWLRRPDFLAAYRRARTLVVEQAIARLQRSCDKAAETLERNLTCGNPQAENAAAKLILAHAVGGVETLDLLGQLEDLQRQLDEVRRGSGNPPGPPEQAEGGGGVEDGDGVNPAVGPAP